MVLPRMYDVGLRSAMPGVIVLLENRILTLSEPTANRRLKNQVPVTLLCHLAIGITAVIPGQVGLEVVSNCCPAMYTFLILLGRYIFLEQTIGTVPLPRSSEDVKLALGALSKASLVRKASVPPVFFLWVLF